jgi:hypothetical protein
MSLLYIITATNGWYWCRSLSYESSSFEFLRGFRVIKDKQLTQKLSTTAAVSKAQPIHVYAKKWFVLLQVQTVNSELRNSWILTTINNNNNTWKLHQKDILLCKHFALLLLYLFLVFPTILPLCDPSITILFIQEEYTKPLCHPRPNSDRTVISSGRILHFQPRNFTLVLLSQELWRNFIMSLSYLLRSLVHRMS